MSGRPTAIVAGVRGRIRAGLVTEARRRRLSSRMSAPDAPAGPEGEVITARFLTEAADRGLVSDDAVRLIWATRVLGFGLGELAGPGRAESTLRVKRWRAEQALRAVA